MARITSASRTRRQLRIDADADVADVVRVGVVEQVLEAEGAAHRQVVGFGEALQVGAGLRVPAAAAQQDQRLFGAGEHGAQHVDLRRRRRGLHRLVAARIGDLRRIDQHVLGQCQHHRAGTAAGGNLEGARDVFGDALGAVDLRDPFGHLAVHAAVIDFLEGLAVDEVVADLADEQDHRRRVLVGGVHADRGVGRARTTGDEADARLARHLAVGVGHEGGAALLAVDDEADVGVVQRVEHVQVAFAGYAESGVGAVDLQGIDQDLAAGAGWVRHVLAFRV